MIVIDDDEWTSLEMCEGAVAFISCVSTRNNDGTLPVRVCRLLHPCLRVQGAVAPRLSVGRALRSHGPGVAHTCRLPTRSRCAAFPQMLHVFSHK